MGRMVTAVVTHAGGHAGKVGPFPVEVPWWAEVEPVVAQLEQTLAVPVVVLRLLTVEGSDGARDGHVTYHAEALEPPGELTPCHFADDDHPLRLPWARPSGVRELFQWAARHVGLTGRPVQTKTWNLSGLFRLPTADGTVWLKAIPGFADAHWGNPVFDGLRAIDFLPPGRRRQTADAWIAAWTAAAPRSRPAEALRIAEPLAQLAYAVRYQEFLDNIEPSERVYHRGDPAASIRRALACASALLSVNRGVYRRDCQAIPLSEVWRADLDDE
jgi:hypothetical protein